MEGGQITYAEGLRFRQARRVWLLLLVAVLIAVLLHNSVLLFLSISLYFVLTIYLLFWPCPRCGRLYSLRFYWFFGIGWPWVNNCLHCGSELVSTPPGNDRAAST